MQIAFVLAATALIWPLVEFMRRGGLASVAAGVALAGLIALAALASYLVLGQWRVKRSTSIAVR